MNLRQQDFNAEPVVRRFLVKYIANILHNIYFWAILLPSRKKPAGLWLNIVIAKKNWQEFKRLS